MSQEQETQTEQTTEVTTEIPSSETLPQSEESSEGTGLDFEEPDFGAITDFVESDDEEEAPPVTAVEDELEAPPVEEIPPEEALAPAELSEGEEAPEEKVEAEAPAEVAAIETAPEPEVKLPTKEDLEGMYTEHREKLLPELEKAFTLSDEEAAALDEQPSKVLPKLAAQLQYDAILSTYNAVLVALPSILDTYSRANTMATQAEGQFAEAWPDLGGPKAAPVVRAAVQAYRAANPRASLEDTIKNAGVMAMINLGLDPMKTQAPAVAKPKPKVVPPKPVAPTGASPVPPVSDKAESNEFADLTEVFLQEMS